MNHEVSIIPLTYGVMPRRDSFAYRLSFDSALVARAAQELYFRSTLAGKPTRVYIPGAEFFEEKISDAKLMAQYVTNNKIPNSVPEESVAVFNDSVNTPTQLEKIRKIRDQGILGQIVIVCASWQENDVAALVRKERWIVVTDQEILEDVPEYRNTFKYLTDKSQTYRLKKYGLQAKAFEVLNFFDSHGYIRNAITKLLGVGVADFEYRGLAKNAHRFVELQKKKFAITN